MKHKKAKPFHFKQFLIHHDQCAMKVGTDGVLLGAWADVNDNTRILDIGTGSGLIAIMSAQKNAKAQIIGIEIDQAAAQQAISNASISKWSERIDIQHISLQNFVINTSLSFDHIISNPPFFKIGTSASSTERNLARQSHSLSFQELLQHSKNILAPNGKLSVILPSTEAVVFKNLALNFGLFLNRECEIYPKKDKAVERVLMTFSFQKKVLISESIIIQHEKRNDWTDDYIQLTRDFYLKM